MVVLDINSCNFCKLRIGLGPYLDSLEGSDGKALAIALGDQSTLTSARCRIQAVKLRFGRSFRAWCPTAVVLAVPLDWNLYALLRALDVFRAPILGRDLRKR